MKAHYFFVFTPLLATAQATTTPETEKPTIHLSPVIGLVVQDGNSISTKDLPVNNGNISDYLMDNPNIRYRNLDNNGLTNGNIRPAAISIHGADSSQTAFTIDGVNVNNDIDPDNDVFDGSMGVLPSRSSEQAYFFDARLLDTLTVYDSNIPAKFGGFTGGVVDSRMRHYQGEPHLAFSYRGTRSDWASLKVDDSIKSRFQNAVPNGYEADFQPNYHKNFFNFSGEYGINANLGGVIGISRRDSRIAQTRQLDPQGNTTRQNQLRRSDNLLGNLSYLINPEQRIELDWRYSNYQEDKFHAANIEQNVNDRHKAYGFTLRGIQNLVNGTLTSSLAYDKFDDSRHANSHIARQFIDYDANYDVHEYESGGYGDSELSQKNLNLSLDYLSQPWQWGDTTHTLNLGSTLTFSQFRFNRKQDTITHQILSFEGIPSSEETSIAKAGTVRTRYQQYAAYLQDDIQWRNFQFHPGIRLEYDSYFHHTNLAPRFSADWQINDAHKLNLGINRYYGRSFASVKLAEDVLQLSDENSTAYRKHQHLKTPYSDEIHLGAEQDLGNAHLALGYTYRNYKNRIISAKTIEETNGEDYYTNGADYKTHSYTLQLQNRTPWTLGISQWDTSLAIDYLNTQKNQIVNPDELVYFKNRLMRKGEMVRKANANNEEWIARLGIDMRIPDWSFTWSNKLYLKGAQHGYEYLDDAPDGTPIYRAYHHGIHPQWNTRLRWEPSVQQQSFYLQADILNVLNRMRKSVSTEGSYTPGREVWLEVGYAW